MSGHIRPGPEAERRNGQAPREAVLPAGPQARLRARAVLATLVVLLALWVARDFLNALAWAVVIALTTWPLYRRFAALFSGQGARIVAPLVFTVVVGIVLFVPVALVAQQIAREGQSFIGWFNALRESGAMPPAWLPRVPLVGERAVRWWGETLGDPTVVRTWFGGIDTERLSAWVQALGGQVLQRTLLFFIALATLFFLLRDGRWMAERFFESADRLLGDPGERLASKMVDAVRATVGGTVVVAVAEGILIGASYVLAGVPNPLLLALLTVAFAMVPLGAWVAFTAGALLLVLHGGSALPAAGVFAWGAAVMLIGDHFVWPALVGGAARLPFVLALVGIFGGLQTFGLLGLFLGPVIMAALIVIWREWLAARGSAP